MKCRCGNEIKNTPIYLEGLVKKCSSCMPSNGGSMAAYKEPKTTVTGVLAYQAVHLNNLQGKEK